MSRVEKLNAILDQLQRSSGDVEAAAIVSQDGLIIASSLPQGIEEMQVAAMSAAMIAMGTRIAQELNRGSLEQLFVKGEKGYVLAVNAGPDAVLLAMARREAKLGLIFLDITRAAAQVAETLA